MKKVWKNWIRFGKVSKKLNRHNFSTIYFTVGFIIIIAIFIGFSQILIRSLKEDSKKAPSLFAKYIYNTKSYLDEAQKNYTEIVASLEQINQNYSKANENSQLLAKIFDRWIRSLNDSQSNDTFYDFFSSEFTDDLKFPLILTDKDKNPIGWRNINIPEREYQELDIIHQDSLNSLITRMEKIDVEVAGEILSYVYFLPIKNTLREPPLPPKKFEDFVKSIEQPIIITNKNNVPIIWNNIQGVSNDLEYTELKEADKVVLTNAINDMNAIPIESDSLNIGQVYITELQAIKNLNTFTLLQLLLVILFFLIGFLGLRLIKRTENDLIWVGLAKETAHQLGTPITSLLGWIEYLKIKEAFQDEENAEMLEFMESDVSHLKKIASRFGKIGSQVELLPQELEPLIEESINYIRNRLPHLGKTISLELKSDLGSTKIKTEKELFGWVLENLLKNCIDALSDIGGKIEVVAKVKGCDVLIYVSDNGKGIDKHIINKIFEAGVTTKKRGWGLGLSLVRRIVVDYHKGKIRVAKSVVNKGTTFEITLPIYQEN
ncbi:HAMP domain-containing histidine kinase [bacterium]|nr:HAMP domain-containing histidine kinase [bacterium]